MLKVIFRDNSEMHGLETAHGSAKELPKLGNLVLLKQIRPGPTFNTREVTGFYCPISCTELGIPVQICLLNKINCTLAGGMDWDSVLLWASTVSLGLQKSNSTPFKFMSTRTKEWAFIIFWEKGNISISNEPFPYYLLPFISRKASV